MKWRAVNSATLIVTESCPRSLNVEKERKVNDKSLSTILEFLSTKSVPTGKSWSTESTASGKIPECLLRGTASADLVEIKINFVFCQ